MCQFFVSLAQFFLLAFQLFFLLLHLSEQFCHPLIRVSSVYCYGYIVRYRFQQGNIFFSSVIGAGQLYDTLQFFLLPERNAYQGIRHHSPGYRGYLPEVCRQVIYYCYIFLSGSMARDALIQLQMLRHARWQCYSPFQLQLMLRLIIKIKCTRRYARVCSYFIQAAFYKPHQRIAANQTAVYLAYAREQPVSALGTAVYSSQFRQFIMQRVFRLFTASGGRKHLRDQVTYHQQYQYYPDHQ